ncbi:MAG: glutamine-hydrolyzing carbamoyl-phosphate synthase small subunit [Elusimicrobia bacterium]|nr:glutamine-hydrolyzing carbamoyl-phosphate synthase small subunit [Elusimicrobiota bacterium]
MKKEAVLVLESGKVYRGVSCGADCEKVGEVVFNTSMTGYQEILTDPSYKGQIVVMTEPHIGNVGANDQDMESGRVYAEGFVAREFSSTLSSWRAKTSLQDFLVQRNVPALSGMDTRALTKHLRETGVQRAILSTTDSDVRSLLKKVKESPVMEGADLVREVTTSKSYAWKDSEWEWEEPGIGGKTMRNPPDTHLHVVVLDFGVKQNILRCLAARGCRVTVLPAQSSSKEILSHNPDGVLLSNGPGDPAAVTYAIATIQDLIQISSQKKPSLPLFGICLGHQLLGLALGGKTFKLKFGHRGSNHPVKDLKTGKIEITTQNHGFCVDMESLAGKDVELTHSNLNDGTLEGMRHKNLPIFSVQYHPESSAGPHDSRYLFDRFIDSMNAHKEK